MGLAEFAILLGGVVAILLLLVAALLLLFVRASARAAREWTAVWEGHSILLRNRVDAEELVIDGTVVARGTNRLALEGTLEHRLQLGDRVVVVHGLIRQGGFGRGLRGHILVDGKWIGGDSL